MTHLFIGHAPTNKTGTNSTLPKVLPHTILRNRNRRGFTLVEMFIVGALIALFSSLAIFGVQQQFNSNIRKAAIGEARNIAVALDFANLDTSIFPRLCWLTESRTGLDFIVDRDGQNVFAGLDIYGRTAPAGAVRTNWEGPYFALSASRSGVSQGRTGIVEMAFDQFGGGNLTYKWPSDPYGTPYTVYMLDLDVASSELRFVVDRAPTDPTAKGNYVNAVVSYGLNLSPGGNEETGRGNFEDLQLFTGIGGRGPFTWRAPNEFLGGVGYDRANIWSSDFIGTSGAGLPSDNSGRVIGISDPGSDDIVFEF